MQQDRDTDACFPIETRNHRILLKLCWRWNFLPITSEACLTNAEACRLLSSIFDHRNTPNCTLSFWKDRFRTNDRNFWISGRRAVADTSIYSRSFAESTRRPRHVLSLFLPKTGTSKLWVFVRTRSCNYKARCRNFLPITSEACLTNA